MEGGGAFSFPIDLDAVGQHYEIINSDPRLNEMFKQYQETLKWEWWRKERRATWDGSLIFKGKL